MLLEHRNYALCHGIMLGSILCGVTCFFYFFYSEILFKATANTHSILFLFIFLLFPIIIVFKQDSAISTFKEYFSVIFLILAFSSFIYALFVSIFYNILDQNLVSVYGLLPSVFLDVNFDSNSDYFIHSFSFASQLNSYIFWLIPCTLYSALISLLMNNIKKL